MGLHTDTYMWKVVPKRDRPGQMFNFETGLWGEASSSQQPPANSTAYLRNWNLVQTYLHWDSPLPATKKSRITELDFRSPAANKMPEVTRDIHVIENQVNVNAYPYRFSKVKLQIPTLPIKTLDQRGRKSQTMTISHYDPLNAEIPMCS